MSVKLERLGNAFVEEISKIINREIDDDNLKFISITYCKITSDLSYAKVYFSTLNKEFLESLKLKTGQLIATNDECGKIIDSSQCYIATISNSEEAKKAKLEDKVKVRLANNKVIDAKISYISQENEEETLIILEINNQISELANYRKISFDLIWWSSTGLKVPNQAIVEENGLNYVVRNRAGYLSKILVKVKRKNEKYSIVSNYSTAELKELGYTTDEIINMRKLSIYDEVVLNPDLSKVQ